MDVDSLTPNQVVAYNLQRARKLRGLNQQTLGQRLAELTGRPWSKATISALERSIDDVQRARRFDADQIVSFAEVLNVPVGWFFLRPASGRADASNDVIAREMSERESIA